jgi:hypothetical protein
LHLTIKYKKATIKDSTFHYELQRIEDWWNLDIQNDLEWAYEWKLKL